MKAKAMKKTLSCILALTLTASMMAESLTAFANGPASGQYQVSGNGGAPEDVEDDAVPADGTVIGATDFAAFKTVLTTGISTKLDSIFSKGTGTYYQIATATLTDGSGDPIAANTDIFVDGALTQANLQAALATYYVKFTFKEVGLSVTRDDPEDTEKITAAAVTYTGLETPVYVSLSNFDYDSTMAAAQALGAETAKIGIYGQVGGEDTAATFAANQTAVTDGASVHTLGIFFKKLGFKEAHTSSSAEIQLNGAGNDNIAAIATIDLYRIGVESVTVTNADGAKYYAGESIAHAFKNATYQLKYNNKVAAEAAVALVTTDAVTGEDVVNPKFSWKLGGAGVFGTAVLPAADSSIQFQYTAVADEAGFVAAGESVTSTNENITILADELADEPALVTTNADGDVVTTTTLPKFDQSFTGEKFYTGAAAIMAKHKNGEVHYLLAVPTGAGTTAGDAPFNYNGAITGGAITGAAWKYTDDEDELDAYVTAYAAWEKKEFAATATTEATAFKTAVTALAPAVATPNGNTSDVDDPDAADYVLNAKGTKITVKYEGGEITLDVNKSRLFDWDATTNASVSSTAVYTGEKLTDLIKDTNKIATKANASAAAVPAPFITKGGTAKNPTYSLNANKTILIVERKHDNAHSEVEDVITCRGLYGGAALTATDITDALLPNAVEDDNAEYTYTYEILVANDAKANLKKKGTNNALAENDEVDIDLATFTNPIVIDFSEDDLVTPFVLATKKDDAIDKASTTLPSFTQTELSEPVEEGVNSNAKLFYTGQVVLRVDHLNKTKEYLVAVPSFDSEHKDYQGVLEDANWYAVTDATVVDAYVTGYKGLVDSDFSEAGLKAFYTYADNTANPAVPESGIVKTFKDAITAGKGTPLAKNAVTDCDEYGDIAKVNVLYNKTAGTMTVTYRGGTYSFNVAAAAGFDLTAATQTALAAKTVYPDGSIFDVIDGNTKVSTTNKVGEVEEVSIVNVSNPKKPKIEPGYTVIITQTAKTAAGVKTPTLVGIYDSTCTAEADQKLPPYGADDELTYTYQISVIKDGTMTKAWFTDATADEVDDTKTKGQVRQAELIAERAAVEENPDTARAYNESTLVTLKLEKDSMATVALATTADLSNAASTFPSFKYGDEFFTGAAALKATHANGYVDYVIGVPTIEYNDAASKAVVTNVTWLYIPDAKDTADAIAALNTYLAAYTTYETDYAAATALTDGTKATKQKAAVTAFQAAVATFAGAVEETIGVIAADWADATANAIGDIVKHDDKYYKFKAVRAANAGWVAASVEEVDVLSVLNGQITVVDKAATAKWAAPQKLYYDFKAQTNPGSITFTYRDKASAAIPVTITGATVDAVQGSIAVRETNTNEDGYNADRIIYAIGRPAGNENDRAGDQNYTLANTAWTVPEADFDNVAKYTIPDVNGSVFFFNLDTNFTDADLKAAIKKGDASITYVLNGDDANPVTKDLYEGLKDNTFGILKTNPLEKSGAQWLGFYYVDNTNIDPQTKEPKHVSFYLPVFVGMSKKIPVINTNTAVQKYYYVGETFNPNGILVSLKDQYSYQVAKADKDLELSQLLKNDKNKYWTVWFDNGENKAPNIAAGRVLTAINAAIGDPKGNVIIYNNTDSIYGEADNATNILKFKTNYAKTISIDTENIKKTYQVGYYPDGTINNQATLPVVEKIVKGAVLTVSFANKTDQADVEIPFDKFVNDIAGDLTEMGGTMTVKKSVTGGRELTGVITVEAVSGVTNGGKATPGKTARYKVSFVPGGVFATDDEIAPVYVDINTEQVEIKKVELYDGKTISADDYYNDANPAAKADDAEDCKPTTQFYVGEDVDADTVTFGYNASRDDLGTKNGSFLVTYTDGKKQLVNYNATNGNVIVDFPVIDTSTEQESRKVSFTYEVKERKGYYEAYKTPEPVELTVSVTQDEVLSFAVNTALQGTIVFYQDDSTYNFDTRTNPDNPAVDVAFEEGEHYYVTAVYKNRGTVRQAFDLLKSSDLLKFVYADADDFTQVTKTTGDKTITFNYTAGNKTTKLELPIVVKEKPHTLTINKNGMQTVFAKGTFTGLDDKGTLKLEIGGEKPVKEVFSINDILADSDNLGEYKGRFKVVDDNNNVITDKTISKLGEGYHTLTFMFYTTIPSDKDKVATVDLDISIIDDYVAKIEFDPSTYADAVKEGFVGGSLNFDKDNGGFGVKYYMYSDDQVAKTLNLSTLPVYATDEDGNPADKILNGVTTDTLKGILANAYITVTTQVKQNNGSYKTVSDYDKVGTKNVFQIADPIKAADTDPEITHLVHIQIDDQSLEFRVKVGAVLPTKVTLGTGADAPQYGKTIGTDKNQQLQGQEIKFTGGKATVTFNDGSTKTIDLATSKNIFIKEGTFDKDSDSAAAQHVIIGYTEDGGKNCAYTESGDFDVTVVADTVQSFKLFRGDKELTAETTAVDPLLFYVGESNEAFNEYQEISAEFEMASGTKITVDNIAKNTLNKNFKFEHLTTSSATDVGLPYDWMNVTYGTKTIKLYYLCVADQIDTVNKTANEYFTADEPNALKTTEYLVGDTALDLSGYYFDVKFNSGKEAKKVALSALPANYYVAILSEDGATQIVANIASATAEEKAKLESGKTYSLGINYKDTTKVKALTTAALLLNAKITYKAASAWADSIVVSAAPTGFGGKKEKLTINQYQFANAQEFIDALDNDLTFALTAKAGTSVIATGFIADGFKVDASGIDFTSPTLGSDYSLKVKYQSKEITIPVTVERATVKELTPVVVADNTITLGVGEEWDGTYDATQLVEGVQVPIDVQVRVKYSDNTNGALINIADEIAAELKKPGSSKVTVDYDTDTAGSIKITVGYAGKTCTLDATVVEPTSVAALNFLVKPTQLKYNFNETPNLNGATVIATFNAVGVPGGTYDAEVDLSLLQNLDFVLVAGKWVVTVDKFDYDLFGAAAKVLNNKQIGMYGTAKQEEKDKEFELVDSTPKSIKVAGVETEYYLAYTGKYAANTSENKLIANFTHNTIPAEDKLPEGDVGTPMTKSAIQSQQFDPKKGTVTVSYLDREAEDTQVVEFDGNVSGTTGEAPIRVKINGAAEVTPTLPTAEGTYTANVSYYEHADITADKVKTDSYSIKVIKDEITGFELIAPDDREVIQGGSINLTGAKATMIFKSGRKVDPIQLTSAAGKKMFKVSDVKTADEYLDKAQTISVQYYEYDENGNEIAVGDPATFEVTLRKNIARKIEVTRRPRNKYSYNTSDDDFDFTGGELTVTWEKAIDDEGNKTSVVDMQEAYKSGDLKVIDKVDFRTAVASKTITIEYLEQKTTIEISIDADPITGIAESTDDPITKKVALEATLEEFIKKGSVVISYELGEDKVVKLSDEHITIDGWDTTKAQAVDLFITYTEGKYKSDKLKVTINVGTNAVESIVCDTEAIKLMKGDALSLADYKVTVTYSDEGTEPLTTTLANADDKLIVKFYKVEGETETEIEAIDTSVVGTYRISVKSAEDKTSTATANVAVTVEDIKVKTIKHAVGAIKVAVNGTLELDTEKVTITYDNAKETTDTVSLATVAKVTYTIRNEQDETVEKIDTTKAGNYTVYVKSAEDANFAETAVLSVVVSDVVVSEFTLSESTLKIKKGGTLDLTDIKATVTYKDSTESKTYDLVADASKFVIDTSVVKTDTNGTYTLKVFLKEEPSIPAEIAVTVYEESVKSMTVTPEAITIKKGTDLTDPTALAALLAPLNPTATITYTDGTTERTEELAIITNIDKFIIDASKVDTAAVGTYDLTVALKEDITKTATIKVTVSDVTVKSFAVTPETIKIKKGTDISDAAKLAAILTPLNPTATVVTVEGETEKTEEIAIITNVDKFVIDASKIDTTKTGDYDLTIALKADPTKTATIKVTVYDKVITDFKLSATTIEVKTGDAADYQKKYEAITVDIAYDEDGTASTASIALNADDARIKIDDIADITKAGTYTITVTSTEDATKSATLTVTVVDGNKISDEEVEDIPEETPSKEDAVVVFTKSGDDWANETGYASIEAALDPKDGIGKGTGEYMIVINKDTSASKALKFPSKATGITIVGEGTLTLAKATTINVKTANINIDCAISGDLSVTLGAGKTLKVGEKTKKLGKITGNKSNTTLDIFGSVTIANLSTFTKVYASDGSVVTIPAKGKVQNIADLKAEMILDGSVTVSGTTVNEGIFHLTNNGTAKQPIAKVTLAGEVKTFLDIIVDNEDATLEGGMKVLYGTGKFDPSKNVNILNKDKQGNELSAVAYNGKKEVRAENTEAISYTIGEGEEKQISSFEALFDLLKDETGAVEVEVNADSVISKNNIPKKLKSLTIKGASDDITVTINLTSIKVNYSLAFEGINIVAKNAKGSDNALNISATGAELSIIDTNITGKSVSIAGNKKNTTLTLSNVNRVDKIQNFATVVVKGSVGVAKNFTVETLKLEDDAFISFDNGCVAKITTLSGEGTIGLAKAANAKKFKSITLTKSDITEEAAVQLVQIEFKATDSTALNGVIVDGSFDAGTVIFSDKSKGAIAYDKIFDATGLKDEGKLTNTKGKVVLG